MPPPDATQNTPLAPSVEKAYYRKCIELKRRLNEVEEANDAARLRKLRLNRAIMKMRLERAFLLEQLAKRLQHGAANEEARQSPEVQQEESTVDATAALAHGPAVTTSQNVDSELMVFSTVHHPGSTQETLGHQSQRHMVLRANGSPTDHAYTTTTGPAAYPIPYPAYPPDPARRLTPAAIAARGPTPILPDCRPTSATERDG